ncbi:MAG TPA: SDR family NAD(P)-dependent oxidoreductase, partial [Ilumatobacteraceae bacterium]|nr:SDR family NAD(P)-dependent oxidoreductase [Ilumatobacteraceae bacterium]
MKMQFSGRLAIVTGASRGIGEAIAHRLARGGATVVITARTMQPAEGAVGSLAEVAAAINAASAVNGGRAIPIQADLSKPADREHLIAETSEHGPVDILVNNAAVAFLAKGSEYPERRTRLMFEVNVHAPMDLCQRVVPAMKERGAGWIVNISSVGAVHPLGPPYELLHSRGIYTVYGMCKAALDRLSTGLAAELNEYGIAVNSLSPWGWVPTPGTMTNDIDGLGDASSVEDSSVIAEAAAFLCSADGRRVSGRVAYSQPLLNEFQLSPVNDNR